MIEAHELPEIRDQLNDWSKSMVRFFWPDLEVGLIELRFRENYMTLRAYACAASRLETNILPKEYNQ